MRATIKKEKWLDKISTNNLLLATSATMALSLWQSYIRLGAGQTHTKLNKGERNWLMRENK